MSDERTILDGKRLANSRLAHFVPFPGYGLPKTTGEHDYEVVRIVAGKFKGLNLKGRRAIVAWGDGGLVQSGMAVRLDGCTELLAVVAMTA